MKASSALIVLTFILSINASAQNILQVNSSEGLTNDTIVVPLSIINQESFISFQCDILLPDGFNYIPGSVSLTSRSVDHVVNVTSIGNNTIRMLSYSLNNTAFLLDTGIVANFSLSTPSMEGNYVIGLENAIIGNGQSENILDSIVNGQINLSPISVQENRIPENKVNCFPNPFTENITINLDVDNSQVAQLRILDLGGKSLSKHDLQIKSSGINSFVFDKHKLLGNNPPNGIYLLCFSFQDKNQSYSIVKEIQFKK